MKIHRKKQILYCRHIQTVLPRWGLFFLFFHFFRKGSVLHLHRAQVTFLRHYTELKYEPREALRLNLGRFLWDYHSLFEHVQLLHEVLVQLFFYRDFLKKRGEGGYLGGGHPNRGRKGSWTLKRDWIS